VRDLNEAPGLNDEQANHFGALTAQLQALQRIYNDFEESAFAADDASSRKSTKKKKKDSTRGRSPQLKPSPWPQPIQGPPRNEQM
jgi:hypothetical protein